MLHLFLVESVDSWFFLSVPAAVTQLITGREEAKNLAGKDPPPDSDPFSDPEFGKNLPVSQAANVRCSLRGMVRPGEHRDLPEVADSSSRNAGNFSSACATKRFPSRRCASTIQIVRCSRSIGENATPTPTGFAEIVSDYFPILHPVPGNRTHD